MPRPRLPAVLPLLLSATSATALFAQAGGQAPEPRDQPSAAVPHPHASPDDPNQDLLLLDDGGPILVRLTMTIDGEPFRRARAAYVATLFEQADADDDGRLTADEAMQNAGLLMGNRGGFSVNLAAHDDEQRRRIQDAYRSMFDPDRDGQVSPSELSALVNRFTGGPEFSITPRPGLAALGETVYRAIDSDEDGRLSHNELERAQASLKPFDADDNDLLLTQELAGPGGFGYAYGAAASAPPMSPGQSSPSAGVVPLDAATHASAAATLLHRYDSDGDRALSPAEFLGASNDFRTNVFTTLDADASGSLDDAELAAFALREPDWTIHVSFGSAQDGAPPIPIAAAASDETSPAPHAEPDAPERLLLATDTLRLELLRSDDASASFAEQSARQQMQFLDGDANAYLEPEETSRAPYIQSMFAELDADGDGKLFLTELAAFFERQYAPGRTRISLVATEHGRSIFETLDRNSDACLSLRELRQASQSLASFDADADGFITRTEVPSRTTWQITRGFGAAYAASGSLIVIQQPGAGAQPVAPPAQGPDWFLRMDRNGDGDLTPREFLGTHDVFARLDANGDGFIDRTEAQAAE